MILILSQENDQTTDDVIDWLRFFGKEYIRLNNTDTLIIENLTLTNLGQEFTLIIQNVTGRKIRIKSNDLTGFWYRRGELSAPSNIKDGRNINLVNGLNRFLLKELRVMHGLCYYLLNQDEILWIGNIFNNETNKLKNLIFAREAGLKIPESIVLSDKKSLIKYYKKLGKDLITKASSDANIVHLDERFYLWTHTNVVDKETLSNVPEHFFPTFFQEKVDKKFELRVFYILEEIYATAIFSQNSEKSQIDFRNYDKSKPNRLTPYILPLSVQRNIKKFMKSINLRCGSLDIIFSLDNEYVFLEVNPIGQFDYYGFPCNYYLPKRVAEILAHGKSNIVNNKN